MFMFSCQVTKVDYCLQLQILDIFFEEKNKETKIFWKQNTFQFEQIQSAIKMFCDTKNEKKKNLSSLFPCQAANNLTILTQVASCNKCSLRQQPIFEAFTVKQLQLSFASDAIDTGHDDRHSIHQTRRGQDIVAGIHGLGEQVW